jgi:hypothetical protein
MKTLLFTLALGLCAATLFAADEKDSKKDAPVYELRIYYANEGKLDALHARFRDHTLKLFEKHGIKNVGYWVPLENPERKLVYFIECPSREARDKSFKEFGADPAWKKAAADSEKDGKLVAKVDSYFLQTTDYSPPLKIENVGDRVFELRTYITTDKNLGNLDDRFKNHTIKLFEKHGMTNVVYFHLTPDQKNADKTLVYLLAHKSKEAGLKSFDAFRADPAWIAAKKASEEKGGGSLTIAEGGVKSEYLKPTDYSPLK